MSQRVEWSEKKPSVRALWSLVNLDSSGAVARKGVIISKVTLPSPPSVRRVSSPSLENEPPFPRRDFVSCGHKRKRGEIKKRKGGKKRNKRRRSSFFASFQRKEGNGTFPSVFQPSSEGTRDVVSVLAFSRDCSRFS